LSRAQTIATVLVALVVIGVALMLPQQPFVQAADDTSSDTRAASVQPASVQPTFVGRKVCAQCHAENFQLHAEHGHANTFARARDSEIARKKYIGRTLDAGDPYGSFRYLAADDGGILAEVPGDVEVPGDTEVPGKSGDPPFRLEYAVGSGHNGVTLLSLIADDEEGTVGIEHRLSWFKSDDQFSVTPGHVDEPPEHGPACFGKVIRGKELHDCVFCHTTTGKIVDQEIVDLVESINCEKCHGPGSEHVRQAQESPNPPPFSVGRNDWDLEAELNLCGRCHRMPLTISPKELREYPDMLTRFQPIGVLRSKCYLESEGQFMCSTCHDPHMTTKARSRDQYEQICVSCHLENSEAHVACPESPQEACIECHMPAVKVHRSISFHDHWIRVRDK
jgi:predicted CXXCH cytochrome family protein